MKAVTERFKFEKICVNSVRYQSAEPGSQLAPMKVYVPNSVLPEDTAPPSEIAVTIEY